MKVIRILVAAAVALALCSCSDNLKDSKTQTRPHIDDEEEMTVYAVGDVLGAWEEGTLDIHYINTGRGESSFLIFPDGTTLLIDMAGSLLSMDTDEDSKPTPSIPSDDISSADVIVNYINHFTSEVSRGHIDYALLSHFHPDHMGTYNTSLAYGGDNSFRLSSVCGVGVQLPYLHFLDRGYPDYTRNCPTDGKMTNLSSFLKWTMSVNGTQCEMFDPGALNQIKMLHDPNSYSDFSIQNLACSGYYWTGKGQNYVEWIPDEFTTDAAEPDENCYSNAFWLTFGKFDYYTGGDHQYSGKSGYYYKDSEAPMVDVIGKMDVAKADHHGTSNCNGQDFLNAISPTVWVTNPWRDVQPNGDTVARVKQANSSVEMYATNFGEYGGASKSDFVSTQGHIVVRVDPTATYFYVYVLDDSDFQYKVKSVRPYSCK